MNQIAEIMYSNNQELHEVVAFTSEKELEDMMKKLFTEEQLVLFLKLQDLQNDNFQKQLKIAYENGFKDGIYLIKELEKI